MEIEGVQVGKINKGFLVLLAVHRDDCEQNAVKMADKICGLRIFEDENGKMNIGPQNAGAELLIVSQFTLYADTSSRRPGFSESAKGELAASLYEMVVKLCRDRGFKVETGQFGADMQVYSLNDGPVTILLDY